MYRIVCVCSGVPIGEGIAAARNIEQEFARHRQRHMKVKCSFTQKNITIYAENDFDSEGLALMDEFSDCLSAFVATPFDGELFVQSVTSFSTNS